MYARGAALNIPAAAVQPSSSMHTTQPKFWKSRAYVRRWRVAEQAPTELTEYIRAVNDESGRLTNPRPSMATGSFLLDLRNALSGLPEPVLALLGDRFLGVYLACDLGCSAIADVVQHNDDVIGIAIALDVDALESRSANDWASWEENEPFSAVAPAVLKVTIAEPDENDRKTALQLLLLHELGHVLVAGREFLPAWWMRPEALGPSCSYDFLDLSWRIDASMQIVPRSDIAGALRRQVRFYSQSSLPTSAALQVYGDLQQTAFPTLYAIANPYEDFSECLALYVHVVLMGKPYRVEVSGTSARVLIDDFESVAARCARKFEFIEDLLGLERGGRPHTKAQSCTSADHQPG